MYNGVCWWRGLEPSNTTAQGFTAAWFSGYMRSSLAHSFNSPTVHCAQRSEFNTMANTLHYSQLQHAPSEMFLYPPATENFSDVSQKPANGSSSSIRTMKSFRPVRSSPARALTNGVRAPPGVMLESWRLKTLRIACVPHIQPLQSIEIQPQSLGKYHSTNLEVSKITRTTITFKDIVAMSLPFLFVPFFTVCEHFYWGEPWKITKNSRYRYITQLGSVDQTLC